MADLDDPAPCLLVRVALLDVGFSAPIDDVRDVAVVLDGAKVLLTAVACVGTQMLASSIRRILARDDDGSEHFVQPLAVMDVGPGHDERQRDATAVHQQVALAAFFSPDPSGWGRRLAVPVAPSSLRRPRSASARRCPASGRTRPSQPSTELQRSPTLPIRGTACGWRLRCRSAPWAAPSTGSPCAARRRSPRTPVEAALVAAPPLACARRSCPPASARGSAVPPAARSHLSPPTIRYVSPRSRSSAAPHAARAGSLPIYG